MDSDRTRGNGFKLKEGRLRLDVRGKFFTESGDVLFQSTRDVVDALSLETFRAKLDQALGNLI